LLRALTPTFTSGLTTPLAATLPTAWHALLGKHCHRTKQENHHHINRFRFHARSPLELSLAAIKISGNQQLSIAGK
jgi:hypothetical protein